MTSGPPMEAALAAYGDAMGRVQALEQLMRVALGEHEARRLIAKGDPWDNAFGEKLLNMDFGKLEQRVCAKFPFSDDQREIVKQARGFRNYLAHQFWIHHLGHPLSGDGITLVIRHAALLSQQIDRVAGLVMAITGADTSRYTKFMALEATKKDVLDGWSKMLSDAEEVFRRTDPWRPQSDS